VNGTEETQLTGRSHDNDSMANVVKLITYTHSYYIKNTFLKQVINYLFNISINYVNLDNAFQSNVLGGAKLWPKAGLDTTGMDYVLCVLYVCIIFTLCHS